MRENVITRRQVGGCAAQNHIGVGPVFLYNGKGKAHMEQKQLNNHMEQKQWLPGD